MFAEHDGNGIATAYRTYGYTLAQIAEHLGVRYSTVSRRLRSSNADDSDGIALRCCKT